MDENTASRSESADEDPLAVIARDEGRAPSEVAAVALRMFLDASSGARRAAYALDDMATDEERRFAASLANRAVLKAYERVLDARNAGSVARGTNTALASEDDIEAEAVRACRR